MTITEAAQLVIQAGALGKGGEIFILDMGKPVKIIELAQKIAKLHGLQPYISGHGGQRYRNKNNWHPTWGKII